jgi:hypothetical protein
LVEPTRRPVQPPEVDVRLDLLRRELDRFQVGGLGLIALASRLVDTLEQLVKARRLRHLGELALDSFERGLGLLLAAIELYQMGQRGDVTRYGG